MAPAIQSWSRTTCVNKASALATLGIQVQVDQTTDLQSGRGWKTILLGNPVPPTERDLGAITSDTTADSKELAATRQIMRLLATGALSQADPHHPILDMLGACANMEALLMWTKGHVPHCLARIKGAQRTALVRGDEPPSIKDAQQVFRTRDIKIAAALTRLGCHVARLDPAESGRVFFVFPQLGTPLDQPAIIVADLVNAYRARKLELLDTSHPFLWMMQCLHNRHQLIDMLNDPRQQTTLIRAPGTGRASLVRNDATDACLDKVRTRLGIQF